MMRSLTPHESPSAPVYEIIDLVKDYNGRRVLNINELKIHHNEILAMVGPSGSGKSTLLRLMNFLEPPTKGEIIFDGNRFQNGSDIPLNLRRRVTTVFQKPMLLNRTVWENVKFGLKLRGSRDHDEFVKEVIREVGLEELVHQRARTLSGGEAQRVALARAIVLEPDVLLLDEPTANLDPYNVGMIEKIIHGLNQRINTTIILVTHNVFQAQRLADRVVFLLEGKTIEVAENEVFFNQPEDPRTRAFISGEMVY